MKEHRKCSRGTTHFCELDRRFKCISCYKRRNTVTTKAVHTNGVTDEYELDWEKIGIAGLIVGVIFLIIIV